MRKWDRIVAAAGLVAWTGGVSGQVLVERFGTGAPPGSACGVALTPFGADPQPTFSDVTSVACPAVTGLDPIRFAQPMSHRVVGAGWGSWSHGYTGDVYYTNGSSAAVVILPSPVRSFALYIEPGPFSLIEFEVKATDSAGGVAVVTDFIEGRSGAAGFGFCATGDRELRTIGVRTTDGTTAFSIGEFQVASRDGCYADCDSSGELDLFDFLCFLSAFGASDPYADCDASGELDFFDFLCFQNVFDAGCP